MSDGDELLEEGDGWVFAEVKVTPDGMLFLTSDRPMRRFVGGVGIDGYGVLQARETHEGVLLQLMIPWDAVRNGLSDE